MIKDIDYLIDNRNSGAQSRKASRYVLVSSVEGSTMIQDIDYLVVNRKPGAQSRKASRYVVSFCS